MRGNTQFPVAVHTLAFIGLSQYLYDELPTSTAIAKSVNTNPVVIRKINSLLKTAGLIDSSQGVKGISLLKEPKDITLQEIYLAVTDQDIFDLHHNVNKVCRIGATINDVLSKPLISAQNTLINELANCTLYDVMKDIAKENNIAI